MTATYQLELTVDEISKLHEGISRHLWRLQKIYPKPSNVRRLIERYQERAEELAMILLEADATGLTEDIEPGPENGPGREPEPSPFGMPPGIEGTAEELAGWIGAHHMEQSQVPLPGSIFASVPSVTELPALWEGDHSKRKAPPLSRLHCNLVDGPCLQGCGEHGWCRRDPNPPASYVEASPFTVYRNGLWVLPTEPEPEPLPPVVLAAMAATVERSPWPTDMDAELAEPEPEPEPKGDRAGPLTTEELPAPEVVKLTAYSRSN